MSEENVRHHLTLILDKTGTSTRVELAKLMFKHVFGLTDREIQIMREIQHPNREIAEKLKMSEGAVKNRICRIFDKTGTSNRIELVLLAYRQKLLP
jgi:DNA-binding NarL/FixJ family response regulator